ncbi:hypothetical protein GN277_06995 [Lachnospiraceae bacterium WCA-9-b2]|uniref:Uncharacterized protein n=1 Tax=Sporofaciens musculi TaxID=2681861 RepID=A0A7X3MEV6_9FIRM|nr:hypothetical protein [Sporofaciens musculi]MXP75136.1 hypothetical protein [Sporofaciens musculi]
MTIAEANNPLTKGLRIIIAEKGFKNLYVAEKVSVIYTGDVLKPAIFEN